MASDETSLRQGAVPRTERESPTIEGQATPIDTLASEAEATARQSSQRRNPAGGKLVLVCALIGFGMLSFLAYYTWRTEQGLGEIHSSLKNDLSALLLRIEVNEKSFAVLGKTSEQLIAWERRLSVVEQASTQSVIPLDTVAALERRVVAIEHAARTSAGTIATLSMLERRLGTVEASQHAVQLSDPTAPPSPKAAVDLSPIESRLIILDQRLESLEASSIVTKTEVRATEAPEAHQPHIADGAALAVVAQTILKAIERGDSFALEIVAAENLGADAGNLMPLKAVAREGTASMQRLEQSFRLLVNTIIDSAAPPKNDAIGLLDQVSNVASKLVRVSPVGEMKGEAVLALVTQIESALHRGAIAQAIAAWDKLPEQARRASESWGLMAKQRVVSEAAAKMLLATAMMELGRKRSFQ